MGDILVRGLSKAYGKQQVLRGFAMGVKAGERVALMGPSGQGKTTLVRLLLGLEKPDGGVMDIPAGFRFAAVFQEDRLCEGLTAAQNVALGRPKGSGAGIVPGLQAGGLAEEDCAKPGSELSGGQRRRVALVRAMEAESDAVVLDEAFKGLDDETQKRAFEYVNRRLAGRTLLVVTHDEQEAQALCERRVYIAEST